MDSLVAEALARQVKDIADNIIVNNYESTREKRLSLDRASAELKEREEIYKQELIHRMLMQQAGMVASMSFVVRLNKKDVPTPKDWPAIRQYILDHNAWELMQNRLSVTAVAERWEVGEEIPGVEHFTTYNVSISKL